eukprot:46201-Prorocentrum_lima.AAC.1
MICSSKTTPAIPCERALPAAVDWELAPKRVITVSVARLGIPLPTVLMGTTLKACVVSDVRPATRY